MFTVLRAALNYARPFEAKDFITADNVLYQSQEEKPILLTEAQISKLNLCLEYFYRDSGNNKTQRVHAVFDGPLYPDQITELRGTLDSREFFIPGQIDLEDATDDFVNKGYELDSGNDHVFNEISDIFLTVAPPSDDRTGVEILDRFLEVKNDGGWDVTSAMRARGWI